VEETRDRLRGLVEAGIALSAELSLDALLQKLVETAAEITGARYAALGVIDRARTGLERFVTTGVDEETYRRIGELPHGRGVLGVLVREATPLRLHDIADDPRSVGFPPGHPEMKTTSPRTTRSSSGSSPARPRSRSRTRGCTSRRRAGTASSSP
jgi:GAF domain-containing protein